MNQVNSNKPKLTLKLTVKSLEKKSAPKMAAEGSNPVIGYT